MNQIKELDKLHIGFHNEESNDDKDFNKKILMLQWQIHLIFGESNKQAMDLLKFIQDGG